MSALYSKRKSQNYNTIIVHHSKQMQGMSSSQMDMMESSHMMGSNMSMIIYWSYRCSFIFQSWETVSIIPFIIGCLVCSIIGASSILFPMAKNKIMIYKKQDLVQSHQAQRQLIPVNSDRQHQPNNEVLDQQKTKQNQLQQHENCTNHNNYLKNKWDIKYLEYINLFCYFVIYTTINVSLMLLLMTMNGFVIIAILLGTTIGYLTNVKQLDQSDQYFAANCCSSH